MAVEPAALSYDATGAPYSDRYRDVYASRDGALGQARHVFLGGTESVQRWRGRDQFVVLETGFGLGTNFLATWQAWRDDPARPRRLHYVSIERHPLPAPALVETADRELSTLARELAAQWPLSMAGLHRREFERGRVVLTLAFGDACDLAPRLAVGADAIYLDGFAVDHNPDMWRPRLLNVLARCARIDARLATWSTASAVRDALASSGFELELRPGYGRKRRMLIGRYAPRYVVRRHEPPTPYRGERAALVVGAGLAGAGCAEALARRGWSVTVIDPVGAAHGASALPWGLLHPQFASDDSQLARLSRAATACARSALQRVAPGGEHADKPVCQPTAVLQLAADARDRQRWRTALAQGRVPGEFVRWTDAESAATHLRCDVRAGGLWWPDGAVISGERMTHALLAAPGVEVRFGRRVERLAFERGVWRALAHDGECVASAAVAVVANACDAPRLLESASLPVRLIRGRVTRIEADALRALSAAMSGDGTLLRAPDGTLLVGATFEVLSDASDALTRQRADASNLARLERMLGHSVAAAAVGGFDGVRCVARDRLPYAGAVVDERAVDRVRPALRGAHLADLPRRDRLYAAFALGSRGLGFAPLAGELIASLVEGEPLPVEADLAGALDPGRVLLRGMRGAQRGCARADRPHLASTA